MNNVTNFVELCIKLTKRILYPILFCVSYATAFTVRNILDTGMTCQVNYLILQFLENKWFFLSFYVTEKPTYFSSISPIHPYPT